MRFAAIAPTAYLHLTNKLRYHMCLAQFLHQKDYFSFFAAKAREKDQVVIMDNGVYDGMKVHDISLLKYVEQLRPQVVVLPDQPGDGVKTVEMSMAFFQKLIDLKWDGAAMGVVHGLEGDSSSFCRTYMKLLTFCRWIGFSRLTKKYGVLGEQPKLRRVQFAQELKRKGLWSGFHKHHALGMLDGNVKELSLLAAEEFEGCDSSAPVWRGLWGWKLSDPGWEDRMFVPDSDSLKFADNRPIAEQNLERVLAACEGKVVNGRRRANANV